MNIYNWRLQSHVLAINKIAAWRREGDKYSKIMHAYELYEGINAVDSKQENLCYLLVGELFCPLGVILKEILVLKKCRNSLV